MAELQATISTQHFSLTPREQLGSFLLSPREVFFFSFAFRCSMSAYRGTGIDAKARP